MHCHHCQLEVPLCFYQLELEDSYGEISDRDMLSPG